MSKEAFERLEEIFPRIVKLIHKDVFDSHDFILVLAQKYQKLYVQLLYAYKDNNQPFQSVHKEIAKRLKKHNDLVKQIRDRSSKNIFGLENEVAVWQKVKK
jgi:hypothetical protein